MGLNLSAANSPLRVWSGGPIRVGEFLVGKEIVDEAWFRDLLVGGQIIKHKKYFAYFWKTTCIYKVTCGKVSPA
jgi:hypothetical protein